MNIAAFCHGIIQSRTTAKDGEPKKSRVGFYSYFVAWLALGAVPWSVLASMQNDSSIPSFSREGQIALAAPGAEPDDLSELVNRVHRQVNRFRREQGLKPLTLHPIISKQAREHSADMARSGKSISHRDFEQRLQDIKAHIPYRAGAENVAANVGYENPAEKAVEGWKNSPGHRKNMLGDFDLTGIGIAQSQEGTYFFTQIFIKRLD